ncbi:MAG: hypothetical protein BroJett011_17890 [Chloroflexota bacterium]|nr:MAG: hypothetical protein BroJett011_17890 [Chloroflexota bacterium]
MRTLFNRLRFNWLFVALIWLLLLGGVIGARNPSDTSVSLLTANQTGKIIQGAEGEITKIAEAILEGDLGEVSVVGDSASPKKVIVFEERHDSRAGQLEIAIMLLRLYEDYGMRYIALEGALAKDGSLDASGYHQLADSDTVADIAVQTLREGEISGAEFMAMAFPNVTVQGIEVAEEYAVEMGENAGSAPTLYLFYTALPSLTDDEATKINGLLEAEKILEAIEFAISTDEWTQSRYKQLTEGASVVPIEDLIKTLDEIEAKATEVGANVDAELQASFQDYKHFFEIASQRSDTMVNNTLMLLDKHPDAPIAMIIGAAHTAKVSDLLNSQGIAHVVIRPKALVIEEPGELSFEVYDRKLQALSVDEAGSLGALLDGRKKPQPVISQPWSRAKAEVKVVAVRLARAVAGGAKPPFNNPPYDLQTEFANYSHVTVNWDSIVVEKPEVIFSVNVKIGGATQTIWGRVVQTDETIGKPTDISLEQSLLQALEDVRHKTLEQLLSEALKNVKSKASPEILKQLLTEALDETQQAANAEPLEQLLSEALKNVQSEANPETLEQLLFEALEMVKSNKTLNHLLLEALDSTRNEANPEMLEQLLSEALDKAQGEANAEALKKVLSKALDNVRDKADPETLEQNLSEALNEDPTVIQITPDINAKFSNSKQGVSKPVSQS